MIFQETVLEGAFIIEPERLEDDRGFFARTFCEREFAEHGLSTRWPQCNISFNARKGTLRGMHFQRDPHGEVKLVWCTSGAVFDVIIDLRPQSATFKKHVAVELSAENRKMFYIPEGFAHGFITLTDNAQLFYHMSDFFVPDAACAVRYNDPAFGIDWPAEISIISEKDSTIPDFDEAVLRPIE